MVLGSICGVSYGSRNSIGVKMLRAVRSAPTESRSRNRGCRRMAARRGYDPGVTRGAGQALMQLRGRLFGGDEQAVCRRAIFALYLFGVALIVKTLVQGE